MAYNAASTLSKVLDRIPPHVQERVDEICVFDDASPDATYLVSEGYRLVRGNPKLSVHRNAKNLGYGGNQKMGYRYAIEKGFDIVVLLHGDGQYAPEVMDELIDPIAKGEADAVFGTRMSTPYGALKGGMPLYKFAGNKVLTWFENSMLDMELSEFHSGYRAYSVDALSRIPFEKNTDDFHFDTQIIIQLRAGGYRIQEVPIPTFYGDEICHVNGMKYAGDIVRSVFEYHGHRSGIARRAEYDHVPVASPDGAPSDHSSYQRIADRVRRGTRVLEIGPRDPQLAHMLVGRGCRVEGLGPALPHDLTPYAAYHEGSLDDALLAPTEDGFDYVIFSDVLQSLKDGSLLERARDWLAPGGRVIASTGNVAMWMVRLALLSGRFEYGPRGILDETHVRFFTRKTFLRLLRQAGYRVLSDDTTPIPFTKLVTGIHRPLLRRAGHFMEVAYQRLAKGSPELMAYQIIVEAEAGASSTGSRPE